MRTYEKASEESLVFERVIGFESGVFSWVVFCQGKDFARVSKHVGDIYRVSFIYFPLLQGVDWERGENATPKIDHEMTGERDLVIEKLLFYWNKFIAGANRE